MLNLYISSKQPISEIVQETMSFAFPIPLLGTRSVGSQKSEIWILVHESQIKNPLMIIFSSYFFFFAGSKRRGIAKGSHTSPQSFYLSKFHELISNRVSLFCGTDDCLQVIIDPSIPEVLKEIYVSSFINI